ncbi:MAG TPA: ankyrin repeat domain-containing protein [Gammaproteobacteria bacterium]|nr:ankyrin repeat domain-containing protein [Gammaproteobacteria bacterium]
MAILPAEQAEIEKTLSNALRDISHANPFRLKAGLRILTTTNIETFQNVCSPAVQEDLKVFKKLLTNPETLAPKSTLSESNKADTLSFIKHYILSNLHLLDSRTAILPNTFMVQKSIMEGEHLKSVVHSSALRNVIMSAHYFDSLEKKFSEEGISKERIEPMVKNAKIYTHELHKAVLEGNISRLLKCVAVHGVDINFPNEQGMTPLHIAVQEGLTETVKILLTVPLIKLTAINNNGWTPLHIAARLGFSDIADALLTMPTIDPNAVNSDGWSALHWAAWHGFTETVTVLLAAPGINLNLKDRNDTSPLHLAARNGDPDVISVLLSAQGIDLNILDNEQHTPLHLAAIYNHEAAIKVLLKDAHIEVNLADMDGLTPLHWAARNGHLEILNDMLVHPDIIVDCMDNNFMIPMEWATRNGHISITKILKPYTTKHTAIYSFFNKLLMILRLKPV